MIRSMTAYARREIKGEWGSATWEMRSVNQRYLETYFRLPEQFRSLEPVVRERIRTRLTRGKFECTLRFEPDASAQGELILKFRKTRWQTAPLALLTGSNSRAMKGVLYLFVHPVLAPQGWLPTRQDLDAIARRNPRRA